MRVARLPALSLTRAYSVVATVIETDAKLDQTDGHVDHVAKLKNQQEVRFRDFARPLEFADACLKRETHAYLLSRQVISLLQRTRLQVTITCQAWHAKNMRHHILGACSSHVLAPSHLTCFLDLVDLIEPTMLIVGSRGMGDIKGFALLRESILVTHNNPGVCRILLGSTSHYLIQRSSVPVMVARRRLKKAARHAAHLEHRARVPLSQAKVEKEVTHLEDSQQLADESVAAEDDVKDDGDDEADAEDEARGRGKVRMAV